ncbi:MAG: response regulator [bacterium]|nr:response regulator [bacterium]
MMRTEPNQRALLVRQPPVAELVMLEQGFQVATAKDAVEALRLAIGHRPHLMVAPMESPMLGGLGLLSLLELIGSPIPVVLTTRNADTEHLLGRFANLLALVPEDQLDQGLEQVVLHQLPQYQQPKAGYHYRLKEHEWCSLLAPSSRPRILVAEPSEWFRRLKLMQLDESRQFHLFSATDGRAALLKALLIKPDLILADLQLPELSGPELSQILYVFNRPHPILFLTAAEDLEAERKARNIEGVLGVVSKNLLRDSAAFVAEIQRNLKLAATLHDSLEASYQRGGLAGLLKSGPERGILNSATGLTQPGAPYRRKRGPTSGTWS